LKVYLDTSVISSLFDSRNPERQHLTEDIFKYVKKFNIYLSEITILEIDRTLDDDLREKMRNAVSQYQKPTKKMLIILQ